MNSEQHGAVTDAAIVDAVQEFMEAVRACDLPGTRSPARDAAGHKAGACPDLDDVVRLAARVVALNCSEVDDPDDERVTEAPDGPSDPARVALWHALMLHATDVREVSGTGATESSKPVLDLPIQLRFSKELAGEGHTYLRGPDLDQHRRSLHRDLTWWTMRARGEDAPDSSSSPSTGPVSDPLPPARARRIARTLWLLYQLGVRAPKQALPDLPGHEMPVVDPLEVGTSPLPSIQSEGITELPSPVVQQERTSFWIAGLSILVPAVLAAAVGITLLLDW